MTVSSDISIENIEQLLNWMGQERLFVTWEVRCEIGPDWIGAGQEMRFNLGERSLGPTDFVKLLQVTLRDALQIPNRTDNTVINGEGEITACENALTLAYEWYESVLYQDHHNSGHGIIFLPIPGQKIPTKPWPRPNP